MEKHIHRGCFHGLRVHQKHRFNSSSPGWRFTKYDNDLRERVSLGCKTNMHDNLTMTTETAMVRDRIHLVSFARFFTSARLMAWCVVST